MGSRSNWRFSIKKGYPNYKQLSKVLKNLKSLVYEILRPFNFSCFLIHLLAYP